MTDALLATERFVAVDSFRYDVITQEVAVSKARSVRAPFHRTLSITLVLLTACGGDGTGPSSPSVAAVALSFPGSTLSLAATQPLSPVFTDKSGNPLGHVAGVTWTSSNSAIASVDQSGNVRGMSLGGPVTIRVAVGSQSASVNLTVVPDHIALTPAVSTLSPNQTIQLSGIAVDYYNAPISGLTGPLVWASSNPAVATVDAATGFVTAVAIGDVVISATAAGRTSGVHIEVGVPSAYDGVWTGTGNCSTCAPSTAYTLTFTVVFGRVANFVLTVRNVSTAPNQLCAGGGYNSLSAGASPNARITDGQFTFAMSPPVATFSATFASLSMMTGTNSAISVGALTCAINGVAVGQLTIAAATFTAVKQ